MKKLYIAFFTLSLLLSNAASFAQIVGGNVFLQGHWLEVGVDNLGAFGTCSSPTTYHAHTSAAACSSPGGELDAVYDWGHDGWGTGTPCMMGDYTIPGFPQEGWGIQIGATEYRNWATGSACGGSFNIPGSITGYTNSGGVITGTFTGAAGGLSIVQETRIDTEGSYAVVTTKMYNTTLSAITGVYYERTCDPDNTSFWPGGTSYTENVIVHQNEDAAHSVMVGAYGTTSVYNRTNSWLSLGTKDCRAKCAYFTGFALSPSFTPAAIYAGTSGYITTLNDSDNDDVGIALIYNIGTINSNDSAVVSYAYIYDGPGGLDAAFPDPQLRVAGTTLPSAPYPTASYDTFDVCAHPGLDTVMVNLLHATTGNWTWSHWTWAPSTGLTSTTGTADTIITSVLPPSITYTITGTDSSGTGTMLNCQHTVFYLTILTCNQCVANSPCEGDTLKLFRKGDSTGCTYFWWGPPGSGFTSTEQDPIIFPSTLADAGMFHVIRTLLGVHDTDSVNVTIHPLPVVTASSNAPLCTTPLGTLLLTATPASPGETFTWSGPAGFTSTLQDPTLPSFGPSNTGIYKVVTTTTFGCTDSANTDAELVPPPPAPVIHGQSFYCQGEPFIPFHVTDSAGHNLDTIAHWYPSGTGGTSSTTPTTVNTSVPGLYTVYASVIVGSCESPRGSFTVRVRTTPAAPLVTGILEYCQHIGPFAPLLVHTTATGTINWYMSATGGTSTTAEPIPNIDVVPAGGVYHYWVSQTDSGCESARQPVNITIHPKPAPPVVHPQPWCQFQTPSPVSATPSSAGDNLLWYGPGVTVGTSSAPTPSTVVAPDTLNYYVTETSAFGCVSDSALDKEIIIKKPGVPVTSDVWYCQHDHAHPLSAEVDSAANSNLKWYYNEVPLDGNPTPVTDTVPGVYTFYASQVVNTCESDSAAVNVTIIYKPVFGIIASQPYVCQFDSISLKYDGPELFAPSYTWTLPTGASFATGSHVYDDSVLVTFDSSVVSNYVKLTVSDDSGKCTSDTSIRINIVTQPSAQAYTRPEVCLGDTVLLALQGKTSNAATYLWFIDYVSLLNSQAVTIVSSNSNSGGPFSISWVDSGRHIIEVHTQSVEGCKSLAWYDTINVHMIPDAHFRITSDNIGGCIGDSVQFTANVADYNDSYTWTPAHAFENINKPVAWGRVEEAHSLITLTVTDPFGCTATENLEIDPGSCCTVAFPNAFTPNGDRYNNFFRPLYTGYHHFHTFRILNRWGQVVFNSENSNMQWDGNYNGVPQDMGTYYYYLKYDCGGKTIEQKGDLTLIR